MMRRMRRHLARCALWLTRKDCKTGGERQSSNLGTSRNSKYPSGTAPPCDSWGNDAVANQKLFIIIYTHRGATDRGHDSF